MNTYTFSYTSMSDCKHSVRIQAENAEKAMAEFKAEYGSDVCWFFGVDWAITNPR